MNIGYLDGMWEFAIGFLLLAAQLSGLVLAGRVIMSDRSTQGIIAWVLSLVLLPLMAVPIYLIFGRNRLGSYIRARRLVIEEFERMHPDDPEHPHRSLDEADKPTPLMKILEDLAKLPLSTGNSSRFMFSGRETFDSIQEGIRDAKEYILFQFFIFRNDTEGKKFIKLLKAKALSGVRVYFLVDAIGSQNLDRAFFKDLRKAGIFTGIFSPGRSLKGRLRLNFRNHRKVVIVDGRDGWIGGHNVGIEYVGADKKFGAWRDTHVHVAGPIVNAMQLAFLEDWYWVNRCMLDLHWDVATPQKDNVHALCLATGPTDPDDPCTLAYVHMINQATHRLWIQSPYFVPSSEVIVALQLATLRGVDVRVLIPAAIDHRLVWLSSYYFSSLPQLKKVRFFRYNIGFFHSKMLLVDNDLVSVGTVNFDNRSFRINFEITLIIQEADAISTCRNQMEEDFSNSTEDPADPLALRNPVFRLAARSARLLSPIL